MGLLLVAVFAAVLLLLKLENTPFCSKFCPLFLLSRIVLIQTFLSSLESSALLLNQKFDSMGEIDFALGEILSGFFCLQSATAKLLHLEM